MGQSRISMQLRAVEAGRADRCAASGQKSLLSHGWHAERPRHAEFPATGEQAKRLQRLRRTIRGLRLILDKRRRTRLQRNSMNSPAGPAELQFQAGVWKGLSEM